MVNTNLSRPSGWAIRFIVLLIVPMSLSAAEPKRSTLRELAKESYEASYADFEAGLGKTHDVYRWSKVWLDVELKSASNRPDKEKLYRAHIERMKNLDAQRAASERYTTEHKSYTQFYLAEAEEMLRELGPK